jgi:hypothetical protein
MPIGRGPATGLEKFDGWQQDSFRRLARPKKRDLFLPSQAGQIGTFPTRFRAIKDNISDAG